jgi:hypothetical protein
MVRFTISVIIICLFISCQGIRKSPIENTLVTAMESNNSGKGLAFQVIFEKGKSFNHPVMAVWAEDLNGKYLQTFYVANSIAKGVFGYGDKSTGRWLAGPIRRPAALPYWAHKRGILAEDGLYIPSQKKPLPDAYSGATPGNNFTLSTRLDEPGINNIKIFFEINQPWDWNEYWTNSKYPGDEEYKTSCQPALVYAAEVDFSKSAMEFELKPIGHSHYSGKTGELFTDLNTITTALNIAKSIKVKVP